LGKGVKPKIKTLRGIGEPIYVVGERKKESLHILANGVLQSQKKKGVGRISWSWVKLVTGYQLVSARRLNRRKKNPQKKREAIKRIVYPQIKEKKPQGGGGKRY